MKWYSNSCNFFILGSVEWLNNFVHNRVGSLSVKTQVFGSIASYGLYIDRIKIHEMKMKGFANAFIECVYADFGCDPFSHGYISKGKYSNFQSSLYIIIVQIMSYIFSSLISNVD